MSVLVAVDPLAFWPAIRIGQLAGSLLWPHDDRDRPLIIRPGGLGDLVLASAAAGECGLDPLAVDWLIERRSAPWAEELGLPHACYDTTDPVLRRMSSGTRSLVVNLEQRYGLAAAAARALTSRRGRLVGFVSNRGSFVYDEAIPYTASREHELAAFVRAFRSAFAAVSEFEIKLRPRVHAARGYQVLAIAGTAHPSRALTDEDWVSLSTLDADYPTVITCAPADHALARRVSRMLPRWEHTITTFSEASAAIREADRVRTVDGGMVHVASFWGVPVDAVFTSGVRLKWSPWSLDSRMIFREGLSCQPCTSFGRVPACSNGYACLVRSHWTVHPVTALDNMNHSQLTA